MSSNNKLCNAITKSGKPCKRYKKSGHIRCASHMKPVKTQTRPQVNLKKSYKVCFVGDAKSGKTTTIIKLLKGEFNKKYVPTIGADVYLFNNVNGDSKVNVWDTAGQESFACLRTGYYIGSDAMVIVSKNPEWWKRDIASHGIEIEKIPVLVFKPKEIPDNVMEQVVQSIEM